MAGDLNLLNIDEDLKRLLIAATKPVNASDTSQMSVKQIEQAEERPKQVYLGVSKPEDYAKYHKPDIGEMIVKQALENIKSYKPESKVRSEGVNKKEVKPKEDLKPQVQKNVKPVVKKAIETLKTEEEKPVSPYEDLKKEIEDLKGQLKPEVDIPKVSYESKRPDEEEFEKILDKMYSKRKPSEISNDELIAMAIMGLGVPLVGGLLGQGAEDYSLMKASALAGPKGAESVYAGFKEREKEARDIEREKAELMAKFKMAELTRGSSAEALNAKMDALALNVESKLAQAAVENLLKQADIKRKAVEGESGYGIKSEGLKLEREKLQEVIRHNKALEALKAREAKAKGSKAQEFVDRNFAKEYVEALSGDKLANAYKGLGSLKEAINQLKTKPGLVGGVLTYGPRFMREAFDKESIGLQERVEYIVQNQLRPVLGAQFTEKEGERLIARSFNPRLGAEENLKRLAALTAATEWALEQKMKALRYFEVNGTLQNYKGLTTISPAQFYEKFDSFLGGGSGLTPSSQPSGVLSPEQRAKMINDIKSKRGY